MRRGSQVTVKIDNIEFPSMGVGELEGKKIYVKGAFPGQVIKGTIKKNRENYSEAKLVEVLERAINGSWGTRGEKDLCERGFPWSSN